MASFVPSAALAPVIPPRAEFIPVMVPTITGICDGGTHYCGGVTHGWLDHAAFVALFSMTPWEHFSRHNPHLLFMSIRFVPSGSVPEPYPGRRTRLGYIPRPSHMHGILSLLSPVELQINLAHTGPVLDATIGSPNWCFRNLGVSPEWPIDSRPFPADESDVPPLHTFVGLISPAVIAAAQSDSDASSSGEPDTDVNVVDSRPTARRFRYRPALPIAAPEAPDGSSSSSSFSSSTESTVSNSGSDRSSSGGGRF
jgi:hypothetical protein